MSKKEQQKVGLCKKFFFHRRRSKTGKKEAFAKKGKKKEPLKEIKKTTLGSLSQSPNLSAGFQQDQGTTLFLHDM